MEIHPENIQQQRQHQDVGVGWEKVPVAYLQRSSPTLQPNGEQGTVQPNGDLGSRCLRHQNTFVNHLDCKMDSAPTRWLFDAQLILEQMSSRDTSTERRLLTRLLEHEEQDSVLEQALPQDAQAAQALLDSLLE